MIRNISFTGNLKINGQLKSICPKKDVIALKKYADDIKGDVFIESAQKYKTGELVYQGYAYVNNRAYNLLYDTKNPFKIKRTTTEMPPEYY